MTSILRRLAGLLPWPARRAIARVAGVLSARTPVLSVIVPVYNVERYLAACLDSLTAQDLVAMEIVIVDDGSTDGSPAIIRAYRARDSRVRAYRQPNGGLGSARNLGVTRARGTYIMFVDSDDLIPAGTCTYLVRSLRASGSDFAVGGVRRLQDGKTYRPSWSVAVHEHDRIGITIDDFPAALFDVVATHRIFRRDFWVDRVGSFAAGLYEDHVPIVAAYVRASRFDILSRVVYDWRIREDQTSIGQQKHQISNLEARVAVKDEARNVVWTEASEPVRAAWVGRVLDTDFPPFIDHALRSDDAYRGLLSQTLAAYLDLAGPESMSYVRVQQKVRTFLVSRGAWEDVEAAQAFFRDWGSIPPTEVRGHAIVIGSDLQRAIRTKLPPSFLELSRTESRMQVCLIHAEWIEPSMLQLTGWAVIRGIDLTNRTPELDLTLVRAGANGLPVPVEMVHLDEATEWVNWRHGAFARAGFTAIIDAGELTKTRPAADWRLAARVAVDAIEREGGVHHAVAGSSASRAAIRSQRIDATVIAVPHFHPVHGFSIGLREPAVEAEELAAADGARTLGGALHSVGSGTPRLRTIRAELRDGAARAETALRAETAGGYRFTLRLPPTESGADEWALFAVDSTVARHRPEWPAVDLHALPAGPQGLRWVRSPRGHTEVAQAAATVTALELTDGLLKVRLGSSALPRGRSAWWLQSGDAHVPVAHVDDDGEAPQLTFSLAGAGGLRGLPSGEWSLMGAAAGEAPLPVWVDHRVAGGLPIRAVGPTHRLRWGIVGARTLRIWLGPPLSDLESSAFGQEQLRRAYEGPSTHLDPTALLVVSGSQPSPTQIRLAAELEERSPPLRPTWAVPDFAVETPAGAAVTLIGSEAWHARLATARAICATGDLEPHVRRRPSQRFLRILEGVSEATVGRDAWWAAGFTPGHIDREIARGQELWDAIIVADQRRTPWPPEEYRGRFLDPDLPISAIIDAWLAGSSPDQRERDPDVTPQDRPE